MKAVFIISIVLFILSSCAQGPPPGYYDELANCLNANDAKMYGAFWCSKCAKQKKLFGDSFQYVNYVECDPRGENEQTSLCLEKNVQSYPDWEFADGSRMVGVLPLETLAEKTGCTLP